MWFGRDVCLRLVQLHRIVGRMGRDWAGLRLQGVTAEGQGSGVVVNRGRRWS